MLVVYRYCQHTFQYNQLEKVHVPLYDPFKSSETIFTIDNPTTSLLHILILYA